MTDNYVTEALRAFYATWTEEAATLGPLPAFDDLDSGQRMALMGALTATLEASRRMGLAVVAITGSLEDEPL